MPERGVHSAAAPAALAIPARRGARPWLELVRLPNLLTAIADVAAGWTLAGGRSTTALALLCGSSVALYAGGMALNDVADAARDALERPERPIPSGRISRRSAALFAGVCLATGVALAQQVSSLAGAAALALVAAILSYDLLLKDTPAGPANMGLCRALNFALGLSAVPAALGEQWKFCLPAWIYIGAVTAISRGEVRGGRTIFARVGAVIATSLFIFLTLLAARHNAWAGAVAAVAFAIAVLPSWREAAADPSPLAARNAVRAGVLGLTLVDASLAGTAGGLLPMLLIAALFPASLLFARRFWVT